MQSEQEDEVQLKNKIFKSGQNMDQSAMQLKKQKRSLDKIND